MRTRICSVAVTAALLAAAALAIPTSASAGFQGSDVFSNVAPPAQTDRSGLPYRYPSGNYALDTHVDVGLTNPGALFALVPHLLASQLWDLTRLLVLAVISLFTWAFSLDLLNGPGGSGGALAPIAEAIESLYTNSLGRSWLVVGILLAGLWGIWKALVQRRYLETTGQLALSVAFVVLALFFVHQPQQTIGRASAWTNELSLAFLSGATRGSLNSPERAKHEVADHLFRTLVHEPWVVLNFGGLLHCVDSEHRPVAADDPRRARCIDHLTSSDGRGGYADRFLRYRPGSEARNAEYEVIRDGAIPSGSRADSVLDVIGAFARGDVADAFAAAAEAVDPADPRQFDGYTVDADDRPAVDIQQQGGGFQRLTMATLVFAGTLGAVLLLGALSLAVVLAQILVLFFLAFAPLALVAAVYPGRGHDLFRAWLGRLAEALLRKALYSLVLAVVLAVSAALLASTTSLGWLLAFGLQAAFYWTVFLYRKDIAARFALATRGSDGSPARDTLPRSLRAIPQRVRRAARTWPPPIVTQRRPATVVPFSSEPPAGRRKQRAGPTGRGERPPGLVRAAGARPHSIPATGRRADREQETSGRHPGTVAAARPDAGRAIPTPARQSRSGPRAGRASERGSSARPGTTTTPAPGAPGDARGLGGQMDRRGSSEPAAVPDELERDRRRLEGRAPRRDGDPGAGRGARRFPWRRP